MSDLQAAPTAAANPPAQARAARLKKFQREQAIVEYLNRGVSVVEIAARVGVGEKRMRAIIPEILARRMPGPPMEFVAIQTSRLNEALLVAYSAMSRTNLGAVDRVIKIVSELDRTRGFCAAERRRPEASPDSKPGRSTRRNGPTVAREPPSRRSAPTTALARGLPPPFRFRSMGEERRRSFPPLRGSAGEGDHAKHGGGGARRRSPALADTVAPVAREIPRKGLKTLNPRPGLPRLRPPVPNPRQRLARRRRPRLRAISRVSRRAPSRAGPPPPAQRFATR